MLKKILSIIIILFCSLNYLPAKDIFEEQRKKFELELEKSKKKFGQYLEDEKNKFSQYLKDSWQNFQVKHGKKSLIDNKPVKPPTLKSKPKKIKKPVKPVKPVQKFTPTQPKVTPSYNKMALDFFGEKINFTKIKKPIKINTNGKLSNQHISQYFEKSNNYEKILQKELLRHKNNLNLDDWATYQLIEQLVQITYSNENHKKLAVWKWMNLLNYDARMGISNNKFILLLPLNRQVYSISYITINQQKYYNFSKNKISHLSTYKKTQKNRKILSYFEPALTRWSKNAKLIQTRQIEFSYKRKKHQVDVQYDLRNFYLAQSYPQFNFDFYFSSQISPLMKTSLKKNLYSLLKSQTQLEQAQALLTMVQTGFDYQTDKEQFGEENYLLPIESIAYPYNDCEDRSIFYAWLVKNLVGVDYIAVVFPNHLTTALNLNTKGKTIGYKGSNYIIADPTYIGSSIGQSIHSKNPKIVYASI